MIDFFIDAYELEEYELNKMYKAWRGEDGNKTNRTDT